MSRLSSLQVVAGRVLTGLGMVAIAVAAFTPAVALATPPSGVPEIDPMSIGSALGVVVGALAMAEGRALKRGRRG